MSERKTKGRFISSPQRKAIAAAFCIIILFATGYAIGVLANINVHIPVQYQEAVATTEVSTTVPTTTEPPTVPPTVPTTLPETTTTAPATTAPAEDECCLSGICDMLKGILGTVFPCLAE